MANRHLSRSIALQTLFEWDFNNAPPLSIPIIIERNIEEFGPGLADKNYSLEVVQNVLEHQRELDTIINKAAPEWPIEKISYIDRNVLRLGLCELLYADRKEVPAKVAINEAIELAKNFGGDNSGKFVNGVLGTVYRELGEPGKDEVSKFKETDITKMPKEFLGGALVFRKDGGVIELALVHDVFGYWTLSKGKLEDGESKEEGTIREIREELGVSIDVVGQIGENEYTASDPERGKLRKHVYYFLGETKDSKLTLGESGGLDGARWFSPDEIPTIKIYDDILPIITEGIKLIASRK